MESSIFGTDNDVKFMNQALREARKAYAQDEVPIGAVVVNAAGVVIARGYNQVERKYTQLAHAEMSAIKKAGKKACDWRLNCCWLYVTLEPCSMCMGLIRLSRLRGIVYGASSPLFGFHLDNIGDVSVYKRDIPKVVSRVGAKDSETLLKFFFQKKRIEKGE